MILAPSIAPRLWIHVLKADRTPVTDLITAGITSVSYVTVTAGVRSAPAAISLGAKVADTAAHATGQLVTIRASEGWYAVDAPAGAALATADYAELLVVLVDGTRLVYPTLHSIASDSTTVSGSSDVCVLYPVSQASSSIVPVYISGDNGGVITGLAHNTPGLSIEYKRLTDSAYQPITLVAGTEGTYTAGGFVAEAAGNGWYQVGIPSAAKVAGKTTRLRVKTAGNAYVFGTIYTEPAIAAEVAASLAGTTIVVNSPAFNGENGEDLEVEQGDDYGDTPARIDIESAENLTGLHFVLAARLTASGAGGMALRMQIQSDADGQFALFAPTSEQTEIWTPGTWDLRHRIELGPNKYRTIKRGRLTVRPFDTPATVHDVDPA